MNKTELEIKLALINAIDKVFEVNDGLFAVIDCYYGENHVERMADAAMAVLLATKEGQNALRETEG